MCPYLYGASPFNYAAALDRTAAEMKEDIEVSAARVNAVQKYRDLILKGRGQRELIIEKNLKTQNCFAEGQLYVALSRATSCDTMYMTRQVKDSSLKVSEEVLKFYSDPDNYYFFDPVDAA